MLIAVFSFSNIFWIGLGNSVIPFGSGTCHVVGLSGAGTIVSGGSALGTYRDVILSISE